MQQPNWKLRADCPRDEVEALVRDLGLSETLAAVLVRRGYADPGQACEFLAAELPEHDPLRLGDMEAACEAIRRTVAIIRSISSGLRPPTGSSINSSLGRVASAPASINSLRSSTGNCPASAR